MCTAGALLLVFVFAYGGKLIGARSIEARSNTPVSSLPVAKDPIPLPKVAEKSPDGDSDDRTVNPGMSDNGSTPAGQSFVPGVPSETSTDHCVSDIAQAQHDYTREVQKEKKSLDTSLSINFGSLTTTQYVSDYNKKVTSIFNEYQTLATKENCTWPVLKPALLNPDTLLNL